MKKYALGLILAVCMVCIAVSGCVKPYEKAPVGDQRMEFDSWASRNLAGSVLDSTELGTLIIEDCPSEGAPVKDSLYIRMNYLRELMTDGTITGYSQKEYAQQLGVYDSTSYYGPEWFHMVNSDMTLDVMDIIKGGTKTGRMRVGGRRKALSPGWLSTNERYSGKDAYIRNVTGQNHSLVTLDILDATPDIKQWQNEDIIRYANAHELPEIDSLGRGGIWYQRTKEPSSEKKFPKDTIIYINFIGRLTSGKVFDTNIEKVAKDWGIYSAGANYRPLSIAFDSDSTALKMNGSGVIKGFSLGIWQMHPHEAGVALFSSDLGYGKNGSRPKIPGYAPLVFEIEVVDKP